MIQKNLLVVCGKLSKLKVNNSLKYIKQNGLDVDIIHNNNKNIYKGLDESIYEKSKIQINTQTDYKLCFFLSESNTETNFPNNFENVGYKNIKFISENFMNTYLPHLSVKSLPFTVDSVLYWNVGSVLYWPRERFHASAYFPKNTIRKAMVILTNEN